MSGEEETALHAYQSDAFQALLMGDYPYYIEEAHMAPSNVPTNWMKALKGLGAISTTRPDISARLENALAKMTFSPEAVYCALATVLAYWALRKFLPPSLQIDVAKILRALSGAIGQIEPQARQLHLDWMGPSTEVIWERIERAKNRLIQEYGLGNSFVPSP